MPILKWGPEHQLQNLPKTQTRKLRDGIAGNLETVEVMRGLAQSRSSHPLVRRLAENIVRQAGVRSHEYLNEARAIGTYVRDHVHYLRDPAGIESVQDPLKMIQDITTATAAGDCDDQALLIATLLLSLGHHPSFRMIRYGAFSGPYAHIYVVVYEKNGMIGKKIRLPLDAILKNQPMGSEIPHRSGDEVEV